MANPKDSLLWRIELGTSVEQQQAESRQLGNRDRRRYSTSLLSVLDQHCNWSYSDGWEEWEGRLTLHIV
jgi:hypothetical protein